MYLYKGTNPATGKTQEQSFDDEFDATEFANGQSGEFSKFTVLDQETSDVVYSDKIALQEKEYILKIMSSEEDDDELDVDFDDDDDDDFDSDDSFDEDEDED
ncbi:MAG: hypothetical protein ACK4ND_09000 [Cytophagaceae bacterium]